jgi:type IV pilus assembly protein PilM
MVGMGKGKSLVGLDIGSSAVKTVERTKQEDSYELLNFGLELLGQDTVVDGAIMDALAVSEAIARNFAGNKIKTRKVATSVSGHSVIVKRITVSAASCGELNEAMRSEVQQHIPFDISDVNLSCQPLGGFSSGRGTDVTLVAAKREKILNHTNVL